VSGEEVKALRKRAGLSLAAFAKVLGVSSTTVYSWEHGLNQPSRLAEGPLNQVVVALKRAGK
jgi:DNA-binding transcriptional regulator YiaG